jgi:hypothetical protein
MAPSTVLLLCQLIPSLQHRQLTCARTRFEYFGSAIDDLRRYPCTETNSLAEPVDVVNRAFAREHELCNSKAFRTDVVTGEPETRLKLAG